MQRIVLQTPDGARTYPFIQSSDMYDKAVKSGEIKPGMKIVYMTHVV